MALVLASLLSGHMEGIPYRRLDSGFLLQPPSETPCSTLKIYFPGHAQELGYEGDVPDALEESWVRYLLGPGNYHLAPAIQRSGCPILMLGDSKRFPTRDELHMMFTELEVEAIELLSHSGGFVGLDAALSTWGAEWTSRVHGIGMLDNFYRLSLADKMKKIFGETLQTMCFGFFTDHNFGRYQKSYQSLCPQVQRLSEHKAPVRCFLQKDPMPCDFFARR